MFLSLSSPHSYELSHDGRSEPTPCMQPCGHQLPPEPGLQAAESRSSPGALPAPGAVLRTPLRRAATEPPTQTGGTRGLRELHQFLGEWAVAGIGERRPACGGLGLGARQDGLQTGVRAHLKYLPGLHTDTLCILSCEHRGVRDQLLIMYYVCTVYFTNGAFNCTVCAQTNTVYVVQFNLAIYIPTGQVHAVHRRECVGHCSTRWTSEHSTFTLFLYPLYHTLSA